MRPSLGAGLFRTSFGMVRAFSARRSVWCGLMVSPRVRPFRFGIQLRHAPDRAQWRMMAQQAEALGYSTLFLPDHFGDAWSPTVPLTVAAEATTTLKVGALVYDNDYRHPLVLARDVAAMDLLLEGRVEFGLGAGWMTTDYEQSGIALDSPGVRIARMDEALTVMRRLWTEESVTFSGDHYQLAEATCFPRPFTPGGPPIIVGGGGRKVLASAAKHASIIGVNPELTSGVAGAEAAKTAVADRYLERIEWIRASAGDRFDELELQLLCQAEMVTDDRDSVFAFMAPGFGLSPEAAREVPIVLAGTVDQICDDLVERREQFGFSYIVVHEMEALAPVVARLAGT
jgi:probable F420-dependent oxidoreductase